MRQPFRVLPRVLAPAVLAVAMLALAPLAPVSLAPAPIGGWSAWAQSPTVEPPFPGARNAATRWAATQPAAVLRGLFGGRLTFADARNCSRAPCAVKLLASEVWAGEDGAEMLLLVSGAEPKDAAHATGALLGMALLRREPKGWQLVAGSPGVDVQGAWGDAPATGIVLAGGFGRGVVATPEISSQGVALTTWHLYLPLPTPDGGLRFAQVLQLETGQDSYAACEKEDAACRRRADVQDFSSTVTTEPAPDGGLLVAQAVQPATAAGTPAETRRWHIRPDGTVIQTAGRRNYRRDR